jgi:hypothetical protein
MIQEMYPLQSHTSLNLGCFLSGELHLSTTVPRQQHRSPRSYRRPLNVLRISLYHNIVLSRVSLVNISTYLPPRNLCRLRDLLPCGSLLLGGTRNCSTVGDQLIW